MTRETQSPGAPDQNAVLGGAGKSFLDAILAAAARSPETELIVSSNVHAAAATLADIVAAGQRMGTRMIAAGIRPGDVIGCMLPNWREWPVVAVAAAHAGAVLLPIVTIYGATELKFILGQSGAKWLFTPGVFRNTHFATVIADCGELPALQRHITTGAEFAALEAEGPIGPPVPVAANDMALLIYTSGTTSAPKGVCHSATSMLAELASVIELRGSGLDEAILSPWPPGHVAGAISMYRFLCNGSPLVLMDQWSPETAAELIAKYRITNSSGTPYHLSGLLDAAVSRGHDLASLQQYLVGAAPVPVALIARCEERGLAVYHCYGSSEHPTVTSGIAEDPIAKRLHTEGRPIAGVELRFTDDGGNDMPAGVDGEICTRGPDLFLGYFDPTLNRDAFWPDAWFRTGDIGHLDAEGYLVISDRKKDIIIRGGENISSKEVEEILLAHPAIIDAAAVAAPDDRMGEVVRACVVLKPGAVLSLEELRAHFLAAGIARQKTPERLSVMTELPRNASGKILKNQLRQSA